MIPSYPEALLHLLDGLGAATRVGPRIPWLLYRDRRAVIIDSSRRTLCPFGLFSDSHLYRTGSLKWTRHHASGELTIGAWIAEMDDWDSPGGRR